MLGWAPVRPANQVAPTLSVWLSGRRCACWHLTYQTTRLPRCAAITVGQFTHRFATQRGGAGIQQQTGPRGQAQSRHTPGVHNCSCIFTWTNRLGCCVRAQVLQQGWSCLLCSHQHSNIRPHVQLFLLVLFSRQPAAAQELLLPALNTFNTTSYQVRTQSCDRYFAGLPQSLV